MKDIEFEQRAMDYIRSELSTKQMQEFNDFLKTNPIKNKEFNDLKTFWQSLKNNLDDTPKTEIKKGFYSMLSSKQVDKKNADFNLLNLEFFLKKIFPVRNLTQLTIIFAVVFISGIIGYNLKSDTGLQDQLNAYDQKIASLNIELTELKLRSVSTTDRIQAIHTLKSVNDNDDAIVSILLNKLLYDDNLHVRIAAGKSLMAFSQNIDLVPIIIKAIRNEKEFLVLATLIDNLISLDKDAAKNEIYKIYNSGSSSPEFKIIYSDILQSKSI
ncbi:HEAT repeat domain-containing protein [Winogradskyella sp.]|uniref:HEAT repeat domain-containing protein n=1 Tax=Winogradskyella sp. TaxID=1883156 RepID=UPI0026192D8D|nr:HEAT repeat domain-containing protein [Winogradskyella sp.]